MYESISWANLIYRRAHFRREIMGPVAAEFGFTNPPPLFKVYFSISVYDNVFTNMIVVAVDV